MTLLFVCRYSIWSHLSSLMNLTKSIYNRNFCYSHFSNIYLDLYHFQFNYYHFCNNQSNLLYYSLVLVLNLHQINLHLVKMLSLLLRKMFIFGHSCSYHSFDLVLLIIILLNRVICNLNFQLLCIKYH